MLVSTGGYIWERFPNNAERVPHRQCVNRLAPHFRRRSQGQSTSERTLPKAHPNIRAATTRTLSGCSPRHYTPPLQNLYTTHLQKVGATAGLLSINPASGIDPNSYGRGLSVRVRLGSDSETVRESRDVGDGVGVFASSGRDGRKRSEGLLSRAIDRRESSGG